MSILRTIWHTLLTAFPWLSKVISWTNFIQLRECKFENISEWLTNNNQISHEKILCWKGVKYEPWIIGVVAIPPFKYTTAMVFSKIQSFSILIFSQRNIQWKLLWSIETKEHWFASILRNRVSNFCPRLRLECILMKGVRKKKAVNENDAGASVSR